MQFAVIKTGGKQYIVSEGDKLTIEKLEVEGTSVSFDEVLLIADAKDIKIGTPFIKGASVMAEITDAGKGEKKMVFRYKSKTRYKKKKGHRQPFTEVVIKKISA